MSLPPRLDDFLLTDEDRRQLAEIVRAVDEVLGLVLIGAYLHGSAVLRGLHPQSDIDVLALTARETTADESIASSLTCSSSPGATRPRVHLGRSS